MRQWVVAGPGELAAVGNAEGFGDFGRGDKIFERPLVLVAADLARQHPLARDIAVHFDLVAALHLPVELAQHVIDRVGRFLEALGEIGPVVFLRQAARRSRLDHQRCAEAPARSLMDQPAIAFVRVEQQVFAPGGPAIVAFQIADHRPVRAAQGPARADGQQQVGARLRVFGDEPHFGIDEVKLAATIEADNQRGKARGLQFQRAAARGAGDGPHGGFDSALAHAACPPRGRVQPASWRRLEGSSSARR